MAEIDSRNTSGKALNQPGRWSKVLQQGGLGSLLTLLISAPLERGAGEPGCQRKVKRGENEDVSWWMTLTEEGGARLFTGKTQAGDVERQNHDTAEEPVKRREDSISERNGRYFRWPREWWHFANPRALLECPPLLYGHGGPSRDTLHTNDPKIEADICGSLHFLTAQN